jgi:dihydropyrimidine dehydrogenase (NAD+) subunit PreA
MSKNRLEVDFAGIHFKNPFILSSAPPTMDVRHILRAAKLGWGGAVIKTVTKEPTVDPRTRLGALRKDGRAIGMNNIELISRERLETWTDDWIPRIKREAPQDFVLIASIMSGPEPDGWTKLAEAISQTEADAIELNVSCPHGSPEKHMGAFIGQDPALVEQVTRAAKKGTHLPILVKLTPNVTDIVPIANAAVRGGADAISAINTVESLIGVDIETATPLPIAYGIDRKEQLSTYGGFCGPAVKPIGLRFVSQIAKAQSKIPISGIGGIEEWYSAVEYIMVGAMTLQICTAVMWHGFSIIKPLMKGLTAFMERKGYKMIKEMVGLALPKITTWTALTKMPPLVARVIEKKCSGCKDCVVACADGGYVAIQMRDGIASINTETCDGCGLCYVVCRDDAIEFIHTNQMLK